MTWILNFPVQEELAKNQALEEDDVAKADSAHAAEDVSDAESDSSFGGFASESEAAPKRRKKQNEPKGSKPVVKDEASQAPKETKEGHGKGSKTKDKADKAQKAKQERAEKVLNNAKKALQTLEELSADMIWRSIVRTGEVERRLQKCTETANQLKTVMDNDGFFAENSDVKAMLDHMSKLSEAMTDFKDLCRALRSISAEDLCKELAEGGEVPRLFLAVFDIILSEKDHPTLLDMLSTVAKKLHSVTWLFLGPKLSTRPKLVFQSIRIRPDHLLRSLQSRQRHHEFWTVQFQL